MKLESTLRGQPTQNQVREIGINPNHWYAVGWANQLNQGQVLPVMIWQQSIVLYRDAQGQVQALENVCPHQGVELHLGEVQENCLVCPYHGWQFNSEGQCVHIPYLPPQQKLPHASVRSFPVQEQYGLLWVFPGDRELAAGAQLPEIPEFFNPNCLLVPIKVHFNVHFSLCNENGIDVFHGFLHRNLQSWSNPKLIKLEETESAVRADYQVSFNGWLTRVLGFSGQTPGVTTRTASIHYRYPHYCNSLEGVSSLYLLRLPIGPTETDSFALLFLNQVRIPKWLLHPIQPLIVAFVRNFLFRPLSKQDITVMESQWRTHQAKPDRRYVEINPAVVALRRVMIRQYEKFVQRSTLLQHHTESVQAPETLPTTAL